MSKLQLLRMLFLLLILASSPVRSQAQEKDSSNYELKKFSLKENIRPQNFYRLQSITSLRKKNYNKDVEFCNNVLKKINEPFILEEGRGIQNFDLLTRNSASVIWKEVNNDVQMFRYDIRGNGSEMWIYRIQAFSGNLSSSIINAFDGPFLGKPSFDWLKQKLAEYVTTMDILPIEDQNIKPKLMLDRRTDFITLGKQRQLVALTGENNTSKAYSNHICDKNYDLYARLILEPPVSFDDYQACHFVSIPKIQCTKKLVEINMLKNTALNYDFRA